MIHNMNFIIDLLVAHDDDNDDERRGDLVTGDDRGLISIILPSLFVLSCNTGDD